MKAICEPHFWLFHPSGHTMAPSDPKICYLPIILKSLVMKKSSSLEIIDVRTKMINYFAVPPALH